MSVVIHTCISENGKCPLRHIGVVHSGKHFKMLFKEQFVTLFIVCFVVGAASEVPLLQAADVETWSLTCDSSSLNVTFREYDEIFTVQLSAVEDDWLVKYVRGGNLISKNANFFNSTFPMSNFERGNSTKNTSVFLQLVTVGHPHCSSQRPRLCSVESLLRNVDNQCTFTLKLGTLATSQITTAKFAARNYTKLLCCIGDGCGNGADNGVTTDRHADDSYLEMSIWHIQDNNARTKLCRVTNDVVKPNPDGDIFYEGNSRLNDTGARLECHVPSELDCAEFQCQVITSTSKTLKQSLKHPKFNDNRYCQKADSPLGSATQGWMIGVAVAVPALSVALITVTAALLVYRQRSQRTSEIREGFPLKAASDDNDNDNDNGHNG